LKAFAQALAIRSLGVSACGRALARDCYRSVGSKTPIDLSWPRFPPPRCCASRTCQTDWRSGPAGQEANLLDKLCSSWRGWRGTR